MVGLGRGQGVACAGYAEMPEHRPTNAQAGLYKASNQISTLFKKCLEYLELLASFKTDKKRNELPNMRRWRVTFGYQMGLNLILLGVVSWVSWTMIYDIFRVTQLQRLSPRIGKGFLIVLNKVKVI